MRLGSALLGLSLVRAGTASAADPAHRRESPALPALDNAGESVARESPAPAATSRRTSSTSPLPRTARVRRSAGLLALSVPTLATGVALVVLRTRSFARHVGSCAIGAEQPLCVESAILAHARLAAAGAGLAGAGLGLIATGITAAVPVRRRVWVGEAIAGGTALTLGVAWLLGEHVAFRRGEADDVARLEPWFERRAVAAALLGAGLGLTLGAGVGLLPASRRTGRLAVTPTLTPLGLGLVGRF